MNDAWAGGGGGADQKDYITVARETREQLESDFANEFITWDDLKGWTHGFYHEDVQRACLDEINNYIDAGVSPRETPFFRDFADICRRELTMKFARTAVNTNAAGFMAPPRHIDANAIWELAEDRLIQGLRGAMTTVTLGVPETGKSDNWCHYQALPALKKGRIVASMIRIENNIKYENYRYGGNNSDLLLRASEAILASLDAQAQSGVPDHLSKIPLVKMCRDDAAASGANRARSMSDDVQQIVMFHYISRKAGVQTDLMYQYKESIPSAIRITVSRLYKMAIMNDGVRRMMMMQYLQNNNVVRQVPIYGFIGLKDRIDSETVPCRDGVIRPLEHLDYNTNQMRVAENDFDLSDVMAAITAEDRKTPGGLSLAGTWRAIHDHLISLQKLPESKKPLITTPQSMALCAAVLIDESRHTDDPEIKRLTVDVVERLIGKYGATRGRMDPALRKLGAERRADPAKFSAREGVGSAELCAAVDAVLSREGLKT